jgi:peptide-methionine (R)-S-oxide reductase
VRYNRRMPIARLALVMTLVASCHRANRVELYPVTHTEAEWRGLLTKEQFHILRQSGTEAPYSGALTDFHGEGLFICAGCGAVLFDSRAKFDSHTGWPSFWEPVNPGAVEQVEDLTLGMERSEVRCARCGGHLGHVFDDGPKPTGLRYCIDSAALKVTHRP